MPLLLTNYYCQSGAYRPERSPGSGHRGSVHLPVGLDSVLSGGPAAEGEPRTRKLGYWISTHCWSADRGEMNFHLQEIYICYFLSDIKTSVSTHQVLIDCLIVV